MARRELSEEQAGRVLLELRRRLDQVHGGNVLAFSRELRVSQSGLWQLLNDRTKPSLATAEALATTEGRSVEAILNSARERAAQLAREFGVSETAIQRVLAEPEPEEPRAVLYWVDRMRAVALLGEQSGEVTMPPAETPSPPKSGRLKKGA